MLISVCSYGKTIYVIYCICMPYIKKCEEDQKHNVFKFKLYSKACQNIAITANF